MTLQNKILIGAAVLIVLPLAGGLVGYSQKECPDFDQFRYDSVEYANGKLSYEATYWKDIAEELRKQDSARQADREPVKTIYKRHEARLSVDPDLDTLRSILLAAPTE